MIIYTIYKLLGWWISFSYFNSDRSCKAQLLHHLTGLAPPLQFGSTTGPVSTIHDPGMLPQEFYSHLSCTDIQYLAWANFQNVSPFLSSETVQHILWLISQVSRLVSPAVDLEKWAVEASALGVFIGSGDQSACPYPSISCTSNPQIGEQSNQPSA